MSLDYDVSGITNKAEHFPPDADGLMHNDLHVLIWTSMHVGIGQITESNYAEFYFRAELVNQITPLFHGITDTDTEPVTYTVSREQVHNAIGLRTNVSNMTRAQFFRELGQRMDRAIESAKHSDSRLSV